MILRFADCELDTDRQSLARGGQPVAIEPQVFDLIRLLAENPDRLVSRDEIVDAVWDGRIVSEGAISSRIAAARKAVGDDGTAQRVIRTVQKRGLQLAVPIIAAEADTPPPGPSNAPASRLRYIRGQGGEQLVYRVEGEGPPVMRIDATGWSIEGELASQVWSETAGWLSRHHRQLRYSSLLPRAGEDHPPEADLDAMAENVRIVADAAGFDRFAVLTESGGVHHALRFVARNPDRVSRMVIHGGYVEGRSRRLGMDKSQDVFRHMIEQGWQSESQKIGAAFMLPYLPEGPFEAITEAAEVFQNALPRDAELAIRDLMNTVDSSAYLPRVTCPVLVIHGRNDGVHPVSEARKLVEGLANAELWIMETANHLPVAGHRLWDEYRTGLLDFLARDG